MTRLKDVVFVDHTVVGPDATIALSQGVVLYAFRLQVISDHYDLELVECRIDRDHASNSLS